MIQKEHEHIQNGQHHLQLVIVAENIRTPENVGMMMRLADAFGAEKIYFVGNQSTDLSTKAKRASRNTYKTIPHEFVSTGEILIEEHKKQDYFPIALEITKRSLAIHNINLNSHNKIMIVVGSERQGISENLLQLCEDHYHIRMYGHNSSINVVNALSIGLYKITESGNSIYLDNKKTT